VDLGAGEDGEGEVKIPKKGKIRLMPDGPWLEIKEGDEIRLVRGKLKIRKGKREDFPEFPKEWIESDFPKSWIEEQKKKTRKARRRDGKGE
jgi:hypothetical protein